MLAVIYFSGNIADSVYSRKGEDQIIWEGSYGNGIYFFFGMGQSPLLGNSFLKFIKLNTLS
jgi:hypothetical protein